MNKILFVLLLSLSLAWCLPAHATTQYVNGVQNIQITIASSATTGTASMSACTGTCFYIYQGCSTTATTSQAQALARLTLSGTTWTATRNTSSTNTVTCNIEAIDSTSSLIASVQLGTIAVTSGTSSTATISSVTTGDSVVVYLGNSSAATTFDYEVNQPVLTLTSATVVTANIAALTTNMTVAFEVITFNHAALNQSNQPFSKSWTNSSLTTTQAITSVNVNNAMLFFAGSNNGNTTTGAFDQQWGQITGATVVTITSGIADSDTIVYNGTVVEFISGVLSQSAQHGSTTIAAAASSGTSTITSADVTATALNYTGFTTLTSVATSFANVVPRETQTSATVATSNIGGTVPASKNTVVGWEALTFTNSGGGGGGGCTPAVQTVGLLFPAYFDPPDAKFTTFISDMGSNPNVPAIVVLNPNSGPGASPNAAYTTEIASLKSAGATVLGYIETGYGIANHDFTPQNETTIKADIASWASFYPAIQGIFMDEMDDTASSSGCTSRSGGNCVLLYSDLNTYAKSLGLNLVIGNPGENTISAYFSSSPPAADKYVINETDTVYPTSGQANNGGLGTNATRLSVAYGVAFNSGNFALMTASNSYVWATDDVDPNPYDTIPTYLSTLFTTLQALDSSTGNCAFSHAFIF